MSANPFDGLQPAPLWKYFQALTQIPRCSGNEAASAKWVLDLAKQHKLEAQQDQGGNVVVRLPASKGKEKAPVVVLQGHLDMVGEKNSDSSHNFDTDPIRVLREGEYLTADGTTLGADNGIGLAAGLALIEDSAAVHGPLELLFTVQEETGLDGAQALQPGFVQGKIMLNLDSEEEGSLYVGCAGGADTHVLVPVEREAAKGEGLRIKIIGLKGGHSGLDINLGRANALKLLAHLLDAARQELSFSLAAFDGGDKHNAIPREAFAELVLDVKDRAKLEGVIQKFAAGVKTTYGKTDEGASIQMETFAVKAKAMNQATRDRLIDLVLAMPHGVLTMSQAVAGLVETSTNLAVVKTKDDQVLLQESSRSSVAPEVAMVQNSLCALARVAGAKPEPKGGYPGWQPNMDSKVLALAKVVHEKVTGKVPEVKAIHAGLECGIIGEKFGGMDMLSFGPDINFPHSPSERLHIASAGRFYDFLKALLAELAK